MPSTYLYDPSTDQTIENLQTAVDGSFSDLQNQINTMDQKAISSPTELESHVTRLCDTFRENMHEIIEKVKRTLVKNIPKDPREASNWRNKILPRIAEFFTALGRYVKSMISKVIKFFVGLWDPVRNSIVWCAQKVACFFAYLKEGLVKLFGKSNILVGH